VCVYIIIKLRLLQDMPGSVIRPVLSTIQIKKLGACVLYVLLKLCSVTSILRLSLEWETLSLHWTDHCSMSI
jgi:hypothetical protein